MLWLPRHCRPGQSSHSLWDNWRGDTIDSPWACLAAVDDLLRTPPDGPSIGLVLCREKNRVVAEYALREISAPMGISGITMEKSLPAALRGSLPTVEEIEIRLRDS